MNVYVFVFFLTTEFICSFGGSLYQTRTDYHPSQSENSHRPQGTTSIRYNNGVPHYPMQGQTTYHPSGPHNGGVPEPQYEHRGRSNHQIKVRSLAGACFGDPKCNPLENMLDWTGDVDNFIRRRRAVVSFGTADCKLGVQDETEVCRAAFPVFFWNHQTNVCEKTLYGGCNKTRNNFRTLEECQRVAETVCKTQ